MPIYHDPQPDDPIVPVLMLPLPDDELATHYETVDVSVAPGVELFRVVHHAPRRDQTPEQVSWSRKSAEQFYFHLSVARHLAHLAATSLGFPAGCRRGACRRARACRGRRHEFDWAFPGPWMPPCATTYRLVDRIRARIGFIKADPEGL